MDDEEMEVEEMETNNEDFKFIDTTIIVKEEKKRFSMDLCLKFLVSSRCPGVAAEV